MCYCVITAIYLTNLKNKKREKNHDLGTLQIRRVKVLKAL